VKARPFLQGAGLAALYMAPFAADFLTPSLGYAYHRLYPLTPIFRAILFLTLLLWLVGGLAFVALERLSPRWSRFFWFFPIVLFPWLVFHFAAGVLNNLPSIAITLLHFGRLTTVAIAIVALVLLLMASKMYERCIAGVRVCYMVAGFGLLVIIPRVGFHAFESAPREKSGFLHDRLPAVSPSAPRIVWLLMDELSYDQAFAARAPDLQLPNFDRLAQSSITFSDLQPDGGETAKVLPSLLLGRPITELHAPYPGLPSYRSTPTGNWQRFNEYDTIFAIAHSLGWTTGVAGWYNPYCRLLPDVLDRCYWVYTEPVGTDLATGLTTTKSVSENMWAMVPAKLNAILQRPTNEAVRTHADDYASVMAHAEDLIEDSRIRFAFVHLPVPHPPGIYDRKRHTIRDGGTYLDNLALADQTLAQLRNVIQSTPAARNTALIVSSDHSWRTSMWKPSPFWSTEAERATNGGKFDPRPVLIVRLPGEDTSVKISKSVNVLIVHNIVEGLLHGQIRTPADLADLVNHQPQASENVQAGN
jgi:sulfatase-like protein